MPLAPSMTVQEAITTKEALDFLQVARRYCFFVETERAEGRDYHIKAREILTTLYHAALYLPEVSTTSNEDFDARVPDDQIKETMKRLDGNIGKGRFYWDVFDPTDEKDTEPVCFDLVDDLVDIYRDVKRGLLIYDLNPLEAKEHGLWQLKFSFETHWGQHCIDALRALHCLITNND